MSIQKERLLGHSCSEHSKRFGSTLMDLTGITRKVWSLLRAIRRYRYRIDLDDRWLVLLDDEPVARIPNLSSHICFCIHWMSWKLVVLSRWICGITATIRDEHFDMPRLARRTHAPFRVATLLEPMDAFTFGGHCEGEVRLRVCLTHASEPSDT